MSDRQAKPLPDTVKIRQTWRNYGGGNLDERTEWYEAIEIEQGTGFYKLEGRGVCFAFVRFWLQSINQGKRGYDLLEEVRKNWKDIVGTQGKTKFDQGWASAGLNQIDDFGAEIRTRHMPGGDPTLGLAKGSHGILDVVLKDRGMFALSVGAATGPGHAIGFYTAPDRLYFLDPNLGQVWCHFDGTTAEQNFRTWFKDVFWPGMGYKDEYAHGRRVLVKFDPTGVGVSGNIEPAKTGCCTII